MKKFTVLGFGLAMLISAPSFAACDAGEIQGVWTRSETDAGVPDSGKTVIWNIQGDSLVGIVQLNDSYTTAGMGPYFEEETSYQAALSSDCTLTLTANESTLRSYRRYEEPNADRTEETVDVRGQVRSFRVDVTKDKLTLIDSKNESVQMSRKN